MTSATNAYARIAFASLAVVVLAGVWMRAALLWPWTIGGFTYAHVVHAHSHLALFGWATAGEMAVIARRLPDARRWPRAHVAALAVATAAAFVSFLLEGYGAASIVVASVHVLLWVGFVAGAWSSVGYDRPAASWLRAALVLLLLAGVAAVLPAVAGATGASPLVARTVVKAFLTLLVQGWIFLAAVGMLLPATANARWSRVALALLAIGTLPSAMAHVPAVESALLVGLGRVGLLLTGAGSLAAGWLLLRGRRGPTGDPMHAWYALAVACVVLKGVGEIGAALADSRLVLLLRPAVIAYLHLVLLGVLTAALVIVLAPHRGARRTAVLHGAGLVVMLGALLVLAGMELTTTASTVLTPRLLNGLALAGAAASAAALLVVSIPRLRPMAGTLRARRSAEAAVRAAALQ